TFSQVDCWLLIRSIRRPAEPVIGHATLSVRDRWPRIEAAGMTIFCEPFFGRPVANLPPPTGANELKCRGARSGGGFLQWSRPFEVGRVWRHGDRRGGVPRCCLPAPRRSFWPRSHLPPRLSSTTRSIRLFPLSSILISSLMSPSSQSEIVVVAV